MIIIPLLPILGLTCSDVKKEYQTQCCNNDIATTPFRNPCLLRGNYTIDQQSSSAMYSFDSWRMEVITDCLSLPIITTKTDTFQLDWSLGFWQVPLGITGAIVQYPQIVFGNCPTNALWIVDKNAVFFAFGNCTYTPKSPVDTDAFAYSKWIRT